jgi:hypothetical protein
LRWWGDRNKKYQKHIGAGGIILGKVASLLVSNDSLEQMDETAEQMAYFTGHCSTQSRYAANPEGK